MTRGDTSQHAALDSPDVTSQAQIIDVFLHPGDFYFGDAETRIRTVLGSCVAITLWHPRLHIGGMCHFLLPSRGDPRDVESGLDGRYGDEAILLFQREIKAASTRPSDYEVKVFGGGNMFPTRRSTAALEVGSRNVRMAQRALAQHGFRIKRHHLAGAGHRNVIFELWSGDVWLRHVQQTGGAEASP